MRTLQTLAILLTLSLAAYFTYAFLPQFAGDAIIHLTFMEHAAAGHWFEFNLGTVDPSSTSPLWTIIGAAIWRLTGMLGTLYGIKTICTASWLATGVLVYVLARHLEVDRLPAALAATFTLAFPGSIQNSLMGMENATFAAVVLGWLVCLARLESDADFLHIYFAAFGAFVGIGSFLRPEAVLVAPAVAWATWRIAGERRARLVTAATTALVTASGLLAFYYVQTGHLIPSSGVARMMAARHDWLSLSVGPLWIYGAAPVRLAAYGPLAAGVAFSWWQYAGRKNEQASVVIPTAAASATAGLALYTFVTGAAHTGRYLIWIMPLATLLAAHAAQRLLIDRQPRFHRALLTAAILWVAAMIATEAYARLRFIGAGDSLTQVASGYHSREKTTDRLLKAICTGGCCDELDTTPEYALTEVQLRFYTDPRIEIASIDGITHGPGNQPLSFAPDGCSNAARRIRHTPELVGFPRAAADQYQRRCPTAEFPYWASHDTATHLATRRCRRGDARKDAQEDAKDGKRKSLEREGSRLGGWLAQGCREDAKHAKKQPRRNGKTKDSRSGALDWAVIAP